MSDTRLIALRYPNRRLAARLEQLWDDDQAVLPISPLLPEAEVRALLGRLRPHRIEDETGATDLPGGAGIGEDVALVVPTSGTSGRPKGVELTHAALRASARAYTSRLGIQPGERWLGCLPLSHIGGLGILARSREAGTTAVIHDRFDPADIAAESETTLISLVPTTLLRLLDAGVDLTRYRAVLVGGGALPATLARRAEDAGVRVVCTYGMTETCGGCNFDGIALDGVECTAVDDQILIRGPVLMQGYRLDPELTSLTLRGGWLHTRDRGRIGDDGALEVFGRIDDVIVSGGEKVPAAEVEELLLTHPLVTDAAVVGVEDAEWGELVAAAIVPGSDTLDPADLKAHLLLKVAPHKVPKRFLIVDRIPRTETGKVRRAAVRELLKDSKGRGGLPG